MLGCVCVALRVVQFTFKCCDHWNEPETDIRRTNFCQKIYKSNCIDFLKSFGNKIVPVLLVYFTLHRRKM